MAEPFELPTDFSTLDDEQLAAALTDAVEAFDAKAKSNLVTTDDITALRSLTSGIEAMRQEQHDRINAAKATAAEIEELAAKVRGEDPAAAPAVEPPAVEPQEAPEPEPQDTPAPEAAASAAVVKRHALNLASVRAVQPRVLPEPPAPTTVITAAVDVPGYTPGAALEFGQITSGIISRANALKTAGGGVGQVISYRHPYQADLIVTDSSSAPEGTTVTLAASSQRRLPQQELIASGGWCAPSETIYELTDTACPDMLWDAPEVQLSRGGLRYYKPLSLDVSALTWVHTEADDISGAEKPCFKIPCPDPTEVRCRAIGVCLEAGILTQRHFPELVSWYLRNSMVAHEIRLRQELFQDALNSATTVTMPETFGALSSVFEAVALQAADMIERHSLCESTSLEVVFPWWSRNLFLTDLARRNGISPRDVTPGMVQDLFSPLGVRIQWARGLAPAVPTEIGAKNPATVWPETLKFLMYPAGSLQIGRGEEVNLGAIHDSSKFKTNDYTALFTEECSTLIDRSVDTRLVTVPVCPSGETGAQTLMVCGAGS
ncbi:major capsid protein [Streptomyces sp. NPDC097727]|uniref:major capsid protein n=1 Tax=Streptomyces sp. NPDC097727 TaxID=3366092 RepID=UPI0038194C1E